MHDFEHVSHLLDRATCELGLSRAMDFSCTTLGLTHFLVVIASSSGAAEGDVQVISDNLPESLRVYIRDRPEYLRSFVGNLLRRTGTSLSFGSEPIKGLPRPTAFMAEASKGNLHLCVAAKQQTSADLTTAYIYWSEKASAHLDSGKISAFTSWIACRAHDAVLRLASSNTHSNSDDCELLSDTERSCLALRAQGHDASEIAKIMRVSPRTVTYYLGRSMRKLGAKRPAEAVTRALMRNEINTFDLSVKAWDQSDWLISLGPNGIGNSGRSSSTSVSRRVVTSLEAVAELISKAIRIKVSARFALVSQVRKSGGGLQQCVITDYGESLRGNANKQGFIRFNPMYGGGAFRGVPFFWERAENDRRTPFSSHSNYSGLTAMVRSNNRLTTLSLVLEQEDCGDNAHTLRLFANELVRTVHDTLSASDTSQGDYPRLTADEIDCLQSLASGLGMKNAANVLQCSPRMARYYAKKIVRKLGAETVAEGIARATELGLLQRHMPQTGRRRANVASSSIYA